MGIKIALAGNPNCGKTTIFNELTGSSQYVGNWPGVTVEKKEGKLKGHKDVTIVDLPGIYSLSPYTLEEVVTRNFLIDERPDVIINIVDGSNIERNLYLTTQLVELGIPVVIALNMMDVVNKNGDIINTSKLSKSLGCEVLETSALKGKGLKELSDKAVEIGKSTPNVTLLNTFSKDTEEVISNIEKLLKGNSLIKNPRWFYIKLFERDEKVLEYLKLDNNTKDKLDNLINNYEESLDDDAESIITTERYDYIGKIITSCVKKKNNSNLSTSDKIDKVVTNRWLALPIFALVMLGIYYIAVTTIGTIATDWVNDTLFAELIQGNVSNWLMNMQVADWLHGLIVDGIIGGVGAVLGFVPQIMVLFFLISLLEDCGYMARVAFIMDRIFRRFGLSGKSFIPMLIGDPAPFVMELPQYRIPSLKGLLIHMWDRGKAFIIKAGTIIFVASGLIWFLQSFSWSLQMVDAQDSILASIGNVIAPIFAPLGFGNWQSAVATVTASLAKENVVATFGVLFGLGAELTESDPNLVSTMGQLFNVVSAYSFMAFTLLAAPCFAAIGAIKREMGSWKWTFIAIGYQTGLAYVVSLIIYQVGRLIFL